MSMGRVVGNSQGRRRQVNPYQPVPCSPLRVSPGLAQPVLPASCTSNSVVSWLASDRHEAGGPAVCCAVRVRPPVTFCAVSAVCNVPRVRCDRTIESTAWCRPYRIRAQGLALHLCQTPCRSPSPRSRPEDIPSRLVVTGQCAACPGRRWSGNPVLRLPCRHSRGVRARRATTSTLAALEVFMFGPLTLRLLETPH